MNRKGCEEDEYVQTETIIPKFAANWRQTVRLDRVIINVTDCVYDVVVRAAKEQKWKTCADANNPEWDVWWTDWAVNAETLMKMQHHQKINHFPGMYVLSRKNLLARNLMRMRKRLPEQYSFFPLTWTLPTDIAELKTYFESKPKGKARTFIVKPQSLSQGRGIFLTRKLQDILPMQNCVVQRYISRPYLLDNLKFDLRIYVLVGSVQPLRLYIYKEGLGRFATEEYLPPAKDNIQDICMHLTNYAINKGSEKFVFNTDSQNDGIGHKRSLEAVMRQLKERGVDIVLLQSRIDELIVKTIISGLSHLRFQYRSAQPQNYRGDMCFQILGFDVILNEDAVPQLLQINYTPSFATDTPLDQSIKKGLIKDTLVLMGVGKEQKEKIVTERREVRELRMRTGKKQKFTMEEREEKRNQAQKLRNQYEATRLGGFRQLFPVQDTALMDNYCALIKLEDELSVTNILPSKQSDETKNEKANENARKIQGSAKANIKPLTDLRRKTEKVSKLPSIEGGQSAGPSKRKSQFVKTSAKNHEVQPIQIQNMDKPTQEMFGRDFSVKIMKPSRCKQKSLKKVQIRQRLVPKTIQFETDILNGHCDPNRFIKLYRE